MGAPYQPHSDTSRAAADAVTPKLNKQQQELLAAFKSFCVERSPMLSGATDDELMELAESGKLRISINGVRARRVELMRKWLIRDSGRTRLTRSNRLATVWELA